MARRLCVLTLLVAARLQAQQTPAKPALAFEEVMIPVRDGVHLQTVILTPSDKTGPLPAPVDQWMNDDMHRYGALRESYPFEYSVLEEADKNKNTNFAFETYDTYSWYLALGPLSNINARYLHGSLPFWNDVVAHPDYDDFWKKEAWVSQLHASTVPNLNVAGFWDQEDPWGPWQIFRHAAEHDPDHTNFMVAGPWYHGEWHTPKGDSVGLIPLGGHETAREFRETIEAPFFRYYLHGQGQKPPWQATMFQSGSNRWRMYAEWPPKEAKPTNLYLHADGSLSFEAPRGTRAYREYISDPANPVPYRQRPISRPIPPATGGPGRYRTSGSSTSGPTSSPS
jgi:uncharacterized protein